jgi:hypothetical protein
MKGKLENIKLLKWIASQLWISADFIVWSAIHDSLENISQPLLKTAEEYTNKPLDTYLEYLGII